MLPMLERDDLLAQLQSAADIARAGSGRIMILEGEAGAGRTRLVTDFLSGLDKDFIAATGYCERLANAHPLSALYDIAGQLGGNFKAVMAGCPDPFIALIDAIRASERSVVLVFEDAQWADPETLDLLRFVCRRIESLRALVIITHRDDETGPDHPFTLALGDFPSRYTTHLSLARLSPEAVSKLAELRGKHPEQIYALSAGNPFLTAELLRTTVKDSGLAELPASIRQATSARLVPLDDASRSWVELLCVFPDGLDRAGLHIIGKGADLDPAELPGWSGFLEERRDGVVCFRHEASRLAVRATLSAGRRHKIKVDALSALAAEPSFVNDHVSLLGNLADLAGVPEAAIDYARKGAEQAIADNRYGEAARLLERVLPMAAALDTRLHARLVADWAELALATTGLNDDGVAALRRCGTVWRRFGCDAELTRYRVLMARVRRELGLFDPYPAEIEALKGAASKHSDGSVRAHALVLDSHDHINAGDLIKGRAMALAAIREARNAGDRVARLCGWLALAQAQFRLGRPGGPKMAQACARIAARDGLTMLSCAVTACMVDEKFAERNLVMAEDRLKSSLPGDAPKCWQGGLTGRLALLRVLQGQLAEGELLAGEVLRDASVRPGMRYHAALAMALGKIRRLGRGASDWLAEAEKLAGASASCRDVAQIKTAAIELAFLSGDYAEATDHCRSAVQSVDGPVGEEIRCEVKLWQTRLGLDEPEAAPSLASDPPALVDLLLDRGMPFEAALSRLMASDEDKGSAFGQAISEFEAIGAEAGVALARRLAKEHAIVVQSPGRKRGPYRAARQHPLGLTRREVQILRMIVNGDGNKEIAEKLGRSLRTVEHHVSAILGKMGTENRIQAVIHAMSRPEILRSGGDDA